MSRYFFNLVGEDAVQDTDGLELPDVENARLHAIELAQALMRRTKLFRDHPARWTMQLADAEGNEVAVIPFTDAATFCADGGESHARAPGGSGRLGWNVQLHLGKEIATADQGLVDGELPEHFQDLLTRLAQAATDKASRA